MLSVTNCIEINSKYLEFTQALCGSNDENSGISMGLEGAWGILLLVSLLWIALSCCMCQSIKHSQQVRYGRVELAEIEQSDMSSTTSIENPNQIVKIWVLLGKPFFQCDDHEIKRVKKEVRDNIAACLDIPPKYVCVTSASPNEDGLLVICMPISPNMCQR